MNVWDTGTAVPYNGFPWTAHGGSAVAKPLTAPGLETFSDQDLIFELIRRGYCVMDAAAVDEALAKSADK